MKLTAMPVPKFTGRVVDYPEWKKLFQDCVQSQYEDSATVMTLRTQALPDSLVNLVPRCTTLEAVWEKLDRKFLDPNRVWKGVKADLKGLDRAKLGDCKYMVALVNKLLDAESLLETVNMVHWLRQEDKIPEYEDFLSRNEKLEWVRLKPKLTGTPWENFKQFLIKMRDEYEDIARTGTVDLAEERQLAKLDRQLRCSICKKKGHEEDTCWSKDSSVASDSKRKCYRCGDEDHIARDCPSKNKGSSNAVQKGSNKKQNSKEQDSFSNYLRVKDCRWCGRTYNSAFSCSGCGKTWPAKSKAEHCLAHCVKYSAASAKERGDMVIKGQNCLICLHHEHQTDSCFGKDQQRTICGLDGCKKRHHPSLHSAPQSVVQSVQVTSIIGVSSSGFGDTYPGVSHAMPIQAQGQFLARLNEKKVQMRGSWAASSWIGGTSSIVEELRAKELEEMQRLLQLPVIDGSHVLLVIQSAMVKHGVEGELAKITIF